MELDQSQRFEAYKNATLRTPEQVMVDLLRAKVIGPALLGNLVKEWDTPAHEEHAEFGNSAWRMFNAATEVMKGTSLELYPARTGRLHQVIDRSIGYAANDGQLDMLVA
jgi:hypothetical protein